MKTQIALLFALISFSSLANVVCSSGNGPVEVLGKYSQDHMDFTTITTIAGVTYSASESEKQPGVILILSSKYDQNHKTETELSLIEGSVPLSLIITENNVAIFCN